MAEVAAPAAQDAVELAQQLGERSMSLPASGPAHLVHDRRERLLGRVGVDRSLAGSPLPAATLDALPQEVEPLVDVADPALLDRQAQAYRREHCCELVPKRFGISAIAVDHDAKIVRIADNLHGRDSGAPMLGACPVRAERLPLRVEVLVEYGQGDIAEQW